MARGVTGVSTLLIAALAIAQAGCDGGGSRADGAGGASTVTRVATVAGFGGPESAIYDEDNDVWYISNINGSSGAVDGNGFISRVTADGEMDSLHFIQGGRGGVTLNAPKGMALVGDTLWVSDIDTLRAFHRINGNPLAAIGLPALFLNDVALGPHGTIYITDTGFGVDSAGNSVHTGPDRVFAISHSREVTVALEGDQLGSPNGITWDHEGDRLILVQFGGTALQTWKPGDLAPTQLATGPGMQDGVEVLDDGRVLYSSWTDSAIHAWEPDTTVVLISDVPSPADIGVDHARRTIAVPLLMEDRVEF